MGQALLCSSSWNRPRFGLRLKSYISCNLFQHLLIHTERHLSAEFFLYEPILVFSNWQVLCGWFEGRFSCIWEKVCVPHCLPQILPVFPYDLGALTCRYHRLYRTFVHGVNTVWTSRLFLDDYWQCPWKLALHVDTRCPQQTLAVVIVLPCLSQLLKLKKRQMQYIGMS